MLLQNTLTDSRGGSEDQSLEPIQQAKGRAVVIKLHANFAHYPTHFSTVMWIKANSSCKSGPLNSCDRESQKLSIKQEFLT